MVSSNTRGKKTVRFDLSPKVQHNSKESASQSRLSKGARECWQEKAVGKGKTKYLSTEEVMNMSTRNVVKRYSRFAPSRKAERLHPSLPTNTHINLSEKKGRGISSIRMTEPKDHRAKDMTMASNVFTVENFNLKSATVETLLTYFAPDASWMGSFKLKGEQTSISFKAYPSSKCRRKVSEFSKTMPEVLEFELLPYSEFLMNVFVGDSPDEKDIGLYFFPHNIERSETYKSLLEHLSEQLYLRSCISGVELFVFSSKVLQEDSHKLNKHDFLWGVFRPIKHKVIESMVAGMDVDITAARESNTIPECSEEVEMEIDMIAGIDVGIPDNAVPKRALDRIYGVEATIRSFNL